MLDLGRENRAIKHAKVEFKINFIATPTKARITSKAKLIHKGRTTQVWDAQVIEDESNRIVAQFRCTQMIIKLK